MPSGKQSKRRRREVRTPPPPVARKAQRRASPRVLLGAAAVLVLAAVALVLAFSLGGGGGSSATSVPARGSLVNALPGAADVQSLLRGIAQRGNVLGRASAPVTVLEYVDLQCPFCREFEAEALPSLVERYIRPGKAKLELRPIAFIGPDSERGRAALIAAGDQNRMFNFAQLLYVNQGEENTGWLDDGMVTSAAASIPGLDVPRLLDERGSSATKSAAAAYDQQASADDITSTPTILVGKSASTARRVELSSPTDVQSVASAIDRALR